MVLAKEQSQAEARTEEGTNDGAGDPTHCELARCNYQGLKCYQPQSYALSNNAEGAL